MDKFLVAAPPHSGEEPAPPPRRHRWRRIVAELDGRIDARFQHRESRLLLDSFTEVGAFDHKYYIHGEERCRTYVDRMISASTINFHPVREGVSAIEFDRKGIYIASVTLSGCLTVHDFETLYCSKYGPPCSMPDESSNYVLHISNRIPLNAVRWNPGNQDEIACTSNQSDNVFLFDIGYVSSAPTEVLHKGKSKFPALYSESCKSLTDITFTSDDKSRIFASGLDGAVYMWDRRSSKTHCLELVASPEAQFNTVKLTVDNRTVFGATKSGTIHVWDLRGGRASAAFQSHNEVQQLLSVKLSTLLGKIASLKIYAVGSSSYDGIYLLDFHPDTSSACHVDYKEETRVSEENQPAENKFVPLSQRVLSCAAHPLSHTIIAGTQFSSLLMLSQKYKSIRNPEP